MVVPPNLHPKCWSFSVGVYPMGLLGKPTILGTPPYIPKRKVSFKTSSSFDISISASVFFRPAKQLKFADIPNGLGALAKVCWEVTVVGHLQIGGECGWKPVKTLQGTRNKGVPSRWFSGGWNPFGGICFHQGFSAALKDACFFFKIGPRFLGQMIQNWHRYRKDRIRRYS